MYAFLLFSLRDFSYLDEIKSFPDIAQLVLPPMFDVQPDVVTLGDFILLAWHAKADPHHVRERINPGPVRHPDMGVFFCSGYTAEGMLSRSVSPCGSRASNGSFVRDDDQAGIFRLIQPSNRGIRLADSPGGVGANVWIANDGQTAQCWSTQPPAIPTFYAKNRQGFCVVGNRPRLVALASTLSNGYTVSREYLPKYIASGFAVDGVTPYPGTRAVPPNRSLLVKGGEAEIAAYPLAPPEATPQNTPLTRKAHTLAVLLKDACWPATAVGQANLFLSGGKDSRTLASALGKGTRLRAFTFGAESQGEGFAAKQVADRLGCAFHFRQQKIISDPIKAGAVSNQASDGLGLNFAHQYQYRQDLSFMEGLPSFHGHGHLLRGGFARTMSAGQDQLNAGLFGAFLSPFASEEAHRTVRPVISDWKSGRDASFRDGRDVLFYANQDFRLGLFTASSSLDLSSKTFMVYPLLDERVARFAESLCVFDRVSERVVFGAIRELASDLTYLPLFGEIWRFDRSPEKRDFADSDHNYQDGFAERQPLHASKMTGSGLAKGTLGYDADKSTAPPARKTAAEYVLASSVAADVRAAVAPFVVDELVSLARTGQNTAQHATRDANTRFNLDSFVNRVFIASTLYDLRW